MVSHGPILLFVFTKFYFSADDPLLPSFKYLFFFPQSKCFTKWTYSLKLLQTCSCHCVFRAS